MDDETDVVPDSQASADGLDWNDIEGAAAQASEGEESEEDDDDDDDEDSEDFDGEEGEEDGFNVALAEGEQVEVGSGDEQYWEDELEGNGGPPAAPAHGASHGQRVSALVRASAAFTDTLQLNAFPGPSHINGQPPPTSLAAAVAQRTAHVAGSAAALPPIAASEELELQARLRKLTLGYTKQEVEIAIAEADRLVPIGLPLWNLS
jgi:hypothetical protein